MNNQLAEIQKRKNSNLSIALIGLNLILAFILSSTGEPATEGSIVSLLYLIPTATILIGAFAFTYHGKGYRWAKWLLGVCIIISILFFGLLLYSWGLGKAFQH